MDNAQKAIMIGVGLFVTILIIAAVMLIVNPAIDLIKDATSRVNGLSESLVARLTADYDNTIVTGSDVRNAVQNNNTTDDMIIEVKATTGGTYVEYGRVKGNGTTSIDRPLPYEEGEKQASVGQLSDKSNTANYVPSSAKYKAELIKSGDVVVGIIFTRQ